MAIVKTDAEYQIVMLCKLIDALLRKDTAQDGGWGYPSFRDELLEMRQSLAETDAVKNYPHTMIGV